VARLLADENFPHPVVQELRILEHEVVTLDDLGKAGLGVGDREVLVLAEDQDRAVLTLNRRHFVRLHRERPGHAGIIVCSLDIDFTGQAKRIDEAPGSEELIGGKLLRINRPG
jgi:hypothetical protein